MIRKNPLVVVTVLAVMLVGGLVVWSQEKKQEKKQGKKEPASQERSVKESEVPAAALTTLKKLAGSATITEFAEEFEHGSKFYEGSWKGPDGHVDVLVTAAGDLVEVEESVPADKVPASVRAAAEKGAGKGARITFEKKTMILYEIHFEKVVNGEMIFTPDARQYQEAGGEKAKAKDKDDDDDKAKQGKDARVDDSKVKDSGKIPKQVMDALRAKFPKAEIRKWTQEKEGNDVIYDIEFVENGRACEADIKEDGTYINYEKAIVAKDLPAAVSKTIEGKFPKATLKEIMEETEVTGKDEKLSAYEVVLVTSDKRTVEIRLSPDGKILEEEVLKGN